MTDIYTRKTKKEFEPKDYEFAVYRGGKIFCNCGAVTEDADPRRYGDRYMATDLECGTCQNKLVYKCVLGRQVIPYIQVLENDSKSIKMKRINLSIQVDDDKIVPIKENMIRVIEFNMLEKILLQKKDNEDISNREDFNRFFHSLPVDELTEYLKSSYGEDSYIYNYIDCMRNLATSRGWGYTTKDYAKGFQSLAGQDYMQILISAKMPNANRFLNDGRRNYWRVEVDKEGRNPAQILGIPKGMVKLLYKDSGLTLSTASSISKAFQNMGKINTVLDIVEDEGTFSQLSDCLSQMSQLHNEYGYTDLKRLTLYLFRDLRITQGIDSPRNGATFLRDYVRMSSDMELKHERYPKSLKREHDVVMLNYRIKKNEIEIKKFKETVEKEEYFKLEYKKKEYSIISPTEPEDLVKEGNQLSHCLSSYVKDVSSDKCRIYFLRKSDELDVPLVSIEVRNKNVRQARGFANRATTIEEREFIKRWAEDNGLTENYY